MQTWMSMTDAAASLGCSVRTLQRRLAADELQGRTTDDGRREVLIDDSLADARRGVGGDVASVVVEQHDRALALAERASGVGQLAVDRLAEQAHAARRIAALVGVTLAVTLSASVVGGAWAAWRIGTADAELRNTSDDLAASVADADALRVALDESRARAEQLARDADVAAAARELDALRLAELRDELARERTRFDELTMRMTEAARVSDVLAAMPFFR